MLHVTQIKEKKSGKASQWELPVSEYLFGEQKPEKSLEANYKEKRRLAVDGTVLTVRTADNKILQQKLISTPIQFQRPPEEDISPNTNELTEPGGKYARLSERIQIVESEFSPNSNRESKK